MFKSLLPFAALIIAAACDVVYPVAVVGPTGTVFRGHANAAFLEGGRFQASDGTIFCSGTYRPVQAGETSTFPVQCSNGLSGIGTAIFEDGISGGGVITMQDGSAWRFIFGRDAMRV